MLKLRRILCVVSFVVLLLFVPICTACADALSGTDVVILLSHTNTMKLPGTNTIPSDPENYRYSAVQAFLSLLDTESSNAGVILFNTREKARLSEINPGILDTLVPMNTIKRASLISMFEKSNYSTLNNLKMTNGVRYDAPLERAIELLDQGSNKNKIIIFLADCEALLHNNDAETTTAEQNTKKLIATANRKGIKILSIALKKNNFTTTLLDEMISSTTNRNSAFVETDAQRLPEVFLEIYNEYIRGDAETVVLESGQFERITHNRQQYEQAEIPVPNTTFKELNIIVEKNQTTAASSFVLLDQDGNVVSFDNKHMLMTDAGSHVIYKMLSPETAGHLVLKFPAGSVKKIEYFLRYNLDNTISVNKKQEKHESVRMEAWLTENGTKKTDADLYKSIKAIANLYKVQNTRTVLMGQFELPANPNGSGYLYEANMRQLLGSDYGQGDYRLSVTFSGLCYNTESNAAAFTLTNSAPVAKSSAAVEFVYNDPDTAQDTTEFTVDLLQYVTDENNDPLSFSVVKYPNGIEAAIIDSHVLYIKHFNQDINGTIIVDVNDSDGGRTIFTQPVNVRNIGAKYQNYHLQIEQYSQDRGPQPLHLRKNESVKLIISPLEGTQPIDFPIQDLTVTCSIDGGAAFPIEINKEGNGAYSCIITAGQNMADYVVHAAAKFGDRTRGTEKTADFRLSIDNQPVQQISSLADMYFTFNDPDGGSDTQEQQVDLHYFVSDADNDPLTYTIVQCPNGLDAAIIPGTSILRVKQSRMALADEIVIRIADNDESAVELYQKVKVNNLSSRYADHSLRLEILGHPMDAQYVSLAKGSDITIRVTPLCSGQPTDDPITKPYVSYAADNGEEIEIKMMPQSGGAYFEGHITTAAQSVEYLFKAQCRAGGISGPILQATLDAHVNNHTPQLRENWQDDPLTLMKKQEHTLLSTIFGRPANAVYWIEPFLLDEATGTVIINAEDAFTDPDKNVETLRYSATLLYEDKWLNTFTANADHQFMLDEQILTQAGHYTLILTCTDNDDAKAERRYDFLVASIHEAATRNGIILLAALAILMLIIAFCMYRAKPMYAKGMTMCLYIGSIPQPVEIALPWQGKEAKSPHKLDMLYTEDVGRHTHSALSDAVMADILVRPSARNRVRIKLLNTKHLKNMQIIVDKTVLTARKREAVLHENKKLTIKCNSSDSAKICPPISYELTINK